ncbi:1-aminocyclopropane-1-carboxylate synthase-like protein 1 isoform X2 [Thalassophryne amazonica]|uniref:1-aminocyclopropane-1-carboxylate synthase-like protein 1 isoform X2 n=1 Tax=Thalassophryne amazonica TaxID=390379 RepID=UPI00147130B9|nr:1-aminocyclopropane-1-carboxylate synthase-like protein 1 isoform X2 [Thalassophryne amazonica]
MDFRSRRHERGSNWTDPEIVELLQLWSDETVQMELESSLRNQRVFDRIAHVLREKGIYRTGDQCREKIKKMKLEYRRIKENLKMRSWKFYDVMDRVMANRPAVSYASLGGAVVAQQQQVLQSPGGPDPFLQGGPHGSACTVGGFLFGPPPKTTDPLDIKCEDADEGVLNSGVAPPEMFYGSGDDQETDGQSVLATEDTLGRGDSTANTTISPSGFSDLNIAGSATAATPTTGGPTPQNAVEEPNEGSHSSIAVRKRKRCRASKASWAHGGSRCGGQSCLDKALVSFLNWQQSAEERLLSLEEARLEREFQAEERREQRDERRAEQERQHELRMFSMLTAHLSASQTSAAAPSVSSSLSQPPSGAPAAQASYTAETTESPPPTRVTACKTSGEVKGKSAETPKHSMYLSNRGNHYLQRHNILNEGFYKYFADKHHETENPKGVVNMGTSENKLCFDLLHKRLTKPDMFHIDPSLLEYADWKGQPFLREVTAKFLSHYCRSPRPLKAENVVMTNGCASLLCAISAVICDPKDAILIPTPFYGTITDDVDLYSDVKLFHVPLDCEVNSEDRRPFNLTVLKLEEGLKRAKQEGFVIRGVILINPHNPLAEIYTPEEMIAFLEFAKRNELHAIINEVYMLSIFDESVTFHNVLSINSLPDPRRTHVLWGLSKDFAMSGMRIGVLYTENEDVVEALSTLGVLHGISGPSQHQAAQLLQDRDWISKEFLPENRRRLKAAHTYVTGELRIMGIPYLDRPAALYVWADFRKYLRESSFEEELSMWRRFLRHKVLLSCGQAFFCSTPGWFRIVFSDQQHRLQLGLKRIGEALKEIEAENAGTDLDYIKDASEDTKESVKEERGDSDNAAIVNSTPSPQSKSSDRLGEKSVPVPDTASPANDDCQASNPTESLESLIGTLRHQIQSSDWLEKNTPELSAGEDPEILDVFKALLQRARK